MSTSKLSFENVFRAAVLLLGCAVLPVMNSCAPHAGGLGQGADAPASYPVNAPLPREEAGNIVTGGLRSGDTAAARKSVDRTLNTPPAESRPGLGTGWGVSVRSDLGYTGFERAGTKPYGGLAAIYYNDREGIEAMTGWKRSSSGMQKAAGGLVEWGVKSGVSTLKNYYSGGRRFVRGKEGQSYMIVVKNLAKSRVEVVLSVDGLDVMDGRSASTKKRGYVINPGETLRVKGWRTSSSRVATFKFSGVGDSYTNLRHGKTRNVGVIGLAAFTEKGVDPWTWMPHEVRRRSEARPFAEAPVYGAR